MSGLPMVHRPGCTKPDTVADCKCGANAHCRTCGWGRGAWPCSCRPMTLPAPAHAATTLRP